MQTEDGVGRFEYEVVDREKMRVSDVASLASEAWDNLKRPESQAYKAAEAAGVDRALLPPKIDDALTIEEEGAPFELATLAVIIATALAPEAKKAVADVWKCVLLPRIRHRWGDHALKEKADAMKKLKVQRNASAKPPEADGE